MLKKIRQLFGKSRQSLTDEQIRKIAHAANQPLRDALLASQRTTTGRVKRRTAEVKAFLQKLAETTLYCNVGNPTSDRSVVLVRDWKEAIASASSIEWEHFVTDRQNERIFGDPNDIEYWEAHNNFMKRLRSRLDRILSPKVKKLSLDVKEQELILKKTRGSMISICDAIAYRDAYDETWTEELAGWYLRGHFPCGWSCEWPEGGRRVGKMLIY